MSLKLSWVGEEQWDRVAETRVQCYAPAAGDLPRFREGIAKDVRAKSGDWLLAERDGLAVGTSTSLSMKMWVRGGGVPCQGVAFVGTVKTHRRGGNKSTGEKGIASQLMRETIRKARERGEVASALMPFRASFYEHFGYGLAEKRTEWTLPLSILPTGSFDGYRFATADDQAAIAALRQREVERGQCCIERSPQGWQYFREVATGGFEAVDRPTRDGPVLAWVYFQELKQDGKTIVRVADWAADDDTAFVRMLHFLASLRDQYSSAVIVTPGDWPVNRMLRESQIPHRIVEHAVAVAKPFTRMQIRVLDHKRWLEAMKLPERVAARATIAVKETEEPISKFRVEMNGGRLSVSPSDASADVECTDVTWASVVSGDLSADAARRLGMIDVKSDAAMTLLRAFGEGPAPFCTEYF